MAHSAEHAGFPLPSASNQSIFSYNTTNSSPNDPISLFYDDEDVDYTSPGDMNSSLSLTPNDTLLDLISKTIVHKAPMDYDLVHITIGITLAIITNIIIGLSIVLKKMSHKQLKADGNKPASEGGFGYLKSKRWWFGFSLLVLGDILGFISLIFAPAILITSLSVLGIVAAAIMSHIILKEKLSKLACIGIGLVIVGCLIVTLCGPKVQEIGSMDELEFYLLSPGFISYIVIVVVVGGVLMYLAPTYGSKYIMVYVLLCGMYASLSIIFSKGVANAIKLTFESENAFIRWSLWACAAGLCMTLMVELIYTQRSLDLFNIYHLIPFWYVVTSGLVILLSTVLFSESRSIPWKDSTLVIIGFIINGIALFILSIDQAQKNVQEEPQESVENECPAIPRPGGVADLYEIPQNSDKGKLSSAASKVTSMMMKPPVPPRALNNLNGVICSEQGKTNSCFSLISEELSTSNISTKDGSSIDSNSPSGSSNRSDFKSSDINNSGNVSDSPTSSCNSHRRGAGVANQCSDKRQQSIV